MTIKYRYFDFHFDLDMLSDDVRACMTSAGLSIDDVDRAIGRQVTYSVISRREGYTPLLGNFLALCNLLDLDLRRYFTIKSSD